jgi:hypothetical protein
MADLRQRQPSPLEIAGDGSEFERIDEGLLYEAQPDFMPWLPHE